MAKCMCEDEDCDHAMCNSQREPFQRVYYMSLHDVLGSLLEPLKSKIFFGQNCSVETWMLADG
jgi:hypothetical protein